MCDILPFGTGSRLTFWSSLKPLETIPAPELEGVQVFRGRLVHSVGAHDDIEHLEDHAIGVKGGKVSTHITSTIQ